MSVDWGEIAYDIQSDTRYQSIESAKNAMLGTIKSAFEKEEFVPGLILIYSLIDHMAWLMLPPSQSISTRTDFCRWVDIFMLPVGNLSCTAIELYSARCALVHTYTLDSSLTQAGEARRIIHCYGKTTLEFHNKVETFTGRDAVLIHVNRLLDAVEVAVGRFLVRIERGGCISGRALPRGRWFLNNFQP